MDILKRILFGVILVGIIGGEVLRWDNGQSIAITLLDVAVILFFGITFFINIFQKQALVLSKVHKFAFWFVIIGLISLVLQVTHLRYYQLFVAFLYALRFTVYTLGISLSIQLLDKKFKKRIPYFLFVISIILAAIGIIQYIWYPELRNLYYAGWDPHLYRIFSTFLDPNFTGLFYLCGAILGIYLFLEKSKLQDTKRKIIFGLGITINILALFLTYSRGAYLAFFVAITIILWRAGKKKFILLGFGIIVLLVIGTEILSPHSEGTKLFRTASIRDRSVSLQQVMAIISHHPFLGVGFDAYRYALQKEGFLGDKADTTHSGAGTDNSFLFAFATTGLAGLVAYLLMTWEILRSAYISKTVIGKSLFASYIALIVGSFFVNALFYPFLLVWMWMLIESNY